MQTEQLLCWSGMTDTQRSTKSGSNEEEHMFICNWLFQDEEKFDIGGGQSFESLSDLIEHYKHNAMVEKSGNVVYLKHPYNATRINAAIIDMRVKELHQSDTSKAGFWEEFEVSFQVFCHFLYLL